MIKNYQITKHFSFYEMTNSTDYPKLVELNRKIVLTDLTKLEKTCKLLEEVRLITGTPIYVLSGFRCKMLNEKVGGSKHSQHMKAEAADFRCELPSETAMLFRNINKSNIKYHQLIYYPKKLFIHISTPTGSNDLQAFIWGSR